MPIKSFKPRKRGYNFGEIEKPPVHIGFFEGRDYYAFADDMDIPEGGKDVSQKKMTKVLKRSSLMRDIKEQARNHIESYAPLYKQVNALTDIVLLSRKAKLSKKEQKELDEAEALFKSIKKLRKRSNEIEAEFLKGLLVDFTNDVEWGMEAEPAAGEAEPPEEETEAVTEESAADTETADPSTETDSASAEDTAETPTT